MNPVVEQIVNVYKKMPLSRKILMGILIFLIVVGFTGMFIWANRVEYKTIYTNLSEEDSTAVVEKLGELGIPYKLSPTGKVVKVPSGKEHDARLGLAAAGLPKGTGVGYEVFDKTDFGTTEFVQNVNYKRALQGELSRTIREMDEVADARVLIVLPKDSVFIEEKRPPSASIMLTLNSRLAKPQVDAVVHLVATAIEDLTPENITVVDTRGRVLYKGATEEEKADEVAGKQLKYKSVLEQNLADRIQSMLETIVGRDNAIVRVTSDIDFDKVDTSEEIYDPDVQVVRSSKGLNESSEKERDPGQVSSVNPIVPPEDQNRSRIIERSNRQDNTFNYEINKTVKRTVKPVAVVQRLSVAAVINGSYINEADEDGNMQRKYVPRTAEEMDRFKIIVEKAMGFSEDRGDQVSVETLPFSGVEEVAVVDTGDRIANILRTYKTFIINGLLLLALVLLVIRPVLKTVRDVKETVDRDTALALEEEARLIEEERLAAIPEVVTVTPVEKAMMLAREDIPKTANIIKGWLSEDEL